jgi:histidine ammonia-lyase
MSLEALYANMKPYDVRLHELRGFPGSVRSAKAIMKCIDGSDLVTGKIKTKVQDAYSMRSSPQVIGAAHDAVAYARRQVEIELNGVGDNPIFLPEYKLTLTGANFQGTPVSLPMDLAGVAITMVCVLSERRLNRLTNPTLSVGLPAFLTKGAGMFSGMMLSQYTADTLIVEQRILSTPAIIASIPAADDQEDFVSMGMNTAIKNAQILESSPERAITLFGRASFAATDIYVRSPRWEAFVANPDPALIAQAGYAYVYMDEGWWHKLTTQQQARFNQPCVHLVDKINFAERSFRNLYSVKACGP